MSTGKYALVNGHQIYYEEYGEGRPIVLLHGGTHTIHSSFEKQIPVFAQQHRVIGIEQVGHGHTPDIPGPFSYSQMAEDTAELLHQLNIADADIVGWSDGAILGLMLGCRHTDLVHRIVASGANLRADVLGDGFLKWVRETPTDQLAGPRETWPDRYVKISPDGPDHWPVVFGKIQLMWVTPIYMEASELANIHALTMIVSGDHEDISIEHSLEIYRSIPKAQLCFLPGTDHWTFGNAADIFNSIILAFIDAP